MMGLGPEQGSGVERAALMVVAALSAIVAVTCGSEGSFGSRVAAPPARHSAGPSAPASPVASPSPATAANISPSPNAPTSHVTAQSLGRFFGALSELERKQRGESVRILWLGDSHTAADFWTGKLRSALAARFGGGGPGFVRAGVQPYRHDHVKCGREGRFRVQPEPPARRAPQGDGVFGLGGMRVLPDAGATATIEVLAGAMSGKASYEILYRLPPGASLRIEIGAQALRVDAKSPCERVAGSPISRLRLPAALGEPLEITALGGAPELFGVIAEGSQPGVVLDAAGIDGARIATPLAWAEEPFIAEVRARAPTLYVVAYGTNEVFDAVRVDRYADQLKALVGRLRRGAPEADCMIVGPPDSAGPGGTGSEPRVSEIDRMQERTAVELGCAYLSAFRLMGGEGSFVRFMQETPRLARPDRIHLTPKGYEKLGEASAAELLRRYDEFRAR